MTTCNKFKQQLNAAKLAGYNSIIILSEDISFLELQELKDCGFNLLEKIDAEDGIYYIISE